MPNELSEKVYPDGTVVKLRDDTAREQIADVIANRAFLPIVNDSTVTSATTFNMGSNNGVYLVVVGQGGGANLLGLYLVKITHYAAGTNVATIVTPTQNPPTVTATEITSNQGGKITITPNGVGFHVAIYKFIMNMA